MIRAAIALLAAGLAGQALAAGENGSCTIMGDPVPIVGDKVEWSSGWQSRARIEGLLWTGDGSLLNVRRMTRASRSISASRPPMRRSSSSACAWTSW